MPNKTEVIFLWNNRKVLHVMKNYDEIKIFGADYWDNCLDEEYLKEWHQ